MGKVLNLEKLGRKPSIVDWVDDTDLRTVSNNADFLRHVQEEYGLRPGEMVIYSNRKFDRWRFVINYHGLMLSAAPPCQTEFRLSLFCAVGQYLIKSFGMKKQQEKEFEKKADLKLKRSCTARKYSAKVKVKQRKRSVA